jgi:hypothetical protein
MDEILTCHLLRYPQMQVTDLYKLLHQAAMGSGHAVRDEQVARDCLEQELIQMGAGPDDPQMDPLTPDGQILRIHLRPYLRTGRDPEALLRAFIQTANEWHPSLDKLKAYAAAAWQLAQAGSGLLSPEEGQIFFTSMEEQGFPAVHHSEIYRYLYRPAYRVVARRFLEAN